MTNPEFSNEFDILYNNITSNQAPGLDEYEKSVFLTLAQNDVARAYANPRENKVQQGLDMSKKRQVDFSTLMSTTTMMQSMDTPIKFDDRSISYEMPKDLLMFINESCKDTRYRYVVIPISYDEYDRLMLKPYQYPIKRGVWRLIVDSNSPVTRHTEIEGSGGTELWVTNSSNKEVTLTIVFSSEELTVETDEFGNPVSIPGIGRAPKILETDKTVNIRFEISNQVQASSQYWSAFIFNKKDAPWLPYIGDMNTPNLSSFPNIRPSDYSGGVITITAPSISTHIELIGNVNKNTLSYTIRYLRKPRPIILTDLGDSLSIGGISTETTCELPESLHPEILQRGVELAKASYTGDLQSMIALGQSSKTDIGVVPQSNR